MSGIVEGDIGPYTIDWMDHLGKGGYANVYKATKPVDNVYTTVATKQIILRARIPEEYDSINTQVKKEIQILQDV